MRNIVYCLPLLMVIAAAGAKENRGRLISAFQIVKFPNDPCVVSNGGKNGTCYTKEECSNHGGKADGTCAEGYGVCCIFSIGCGGQSAENTTYFEVTAARAGRCNARICRSGANVCQIRLDFQTFAISGPSTDTLSHGKMVGGQPYATGKEFSYASNCLTDKFEVTQAPNVPALCGTLTGEHVYFDVSKIECHDLTMSLGSFAQGVTIPTRSFNIRVTQLDCGFENMPPAGCTQYYFGNAGTGYIKSFNYDAGTTHLADQKQVICIRREQGMCRICYSADGVMDVQLSGKNTMAINKAASSCCGYGADGMKSAGVFDCLHIPGRRKLSAAKIKSSVIAFGDEQCGGKGGLTTAATGAAGKTICSKSYPFRVEFYSDGVELAIAAAIEGLTKGFKLKYFETPC